MWLTLLACLRGACLGSQAGLKTTSPFCRFNSSPTQLKDLGLQTRQQQAPLASAHLGFLWPISRSKFLLLTISDLHSVSAQEREKAGKSGRMAEAPGPKPMTKQAPGPGTSPWLQPQPRPAPRVHGHVGWGPVLTVGIPCLLLHLPVLGILPADRVRGISQPSPWAAQ